MSPSPIFSATAPKCTLEQFFSEDFAPALREAAWREIAHPWVDFQPQAGFPLKAELTILSNEHCTLGVTRSSAYVMRTGAQYAKQNDMVMLSLMQSGQLDPELWRKKGPGNLSLCVAQEAGTYHWEHNSSHVYLVLSRKAVHDALGYEPKTQLLSTHCPLAPAFSSQLVHMALLMRQGKMQPAEYAHLLETTRALALLMLRNLGRQDKTPRPMDASENLHLGRHAAALRFMAQHAHQHDLDAAAIALGIGCSRTRLYEAFAAQQQTVMGALREIRLQRAQGLLAQNGRINIGTLAWRCGFADASGFSKLFRARFGLSPSQWHIDACQPHPHPKKRLAHEK